MGISNKNAFDIQPNQTPFSQLPFYFYSMLFSDGMHVLMSENLQYRAEYN